MEAIKKSNGQYKIIREKQIFNGNRRKQQICPCCLHPVIKETNPQIYCNNCKVFIKTFRDKYNYKLFRLRQKLYGFEKLGTPGRINQRLRKAKRVIKEYDRMRSRIDYWKKKCKELENE